MPALIVLYNRKQGYFLPDVDFLLRNLYNLAYKYIINGRYTYEGDDAGTET